MQVLEACSKVFESLCSDEFAIAGKCDVARSTLIDSLAVKFKEAMQDFFAEVREKNVCLNFCKLVFLSFCSSMMIAAKGLLWLWL